MSLTILHNPRCSKSRQILQLLRDKGIEPSIVEYLKTPPNKTELTKILNLLGIEPRELMRTKEKIYKEANLKDPKLSTVQLIQAMVQHPELIERPIVIVNGKAVLGRPPEKVLEIL